MVFTDRVINGKVKRGSTVQENMSRMKIKMEAMQKKSQMEVLDKTQDFNFTISPDRLNMRVDTAKEKTSELEDVATETAQNEAQREKLLRHQAQSLRDL